MYYSEISPFAELFAKTLSTQVDAREGSDGMNVALLYSV